MSVAFSSASSVGYNSRCKNYTEKFCNVLSLTKYLSLHLVQKIHHNIFNVTKGFVTVLQNVL